MHLRSRSAEKTALRTATGLLLLAAAAGVSAQISLAPAVDLALRNDPRVKMAEQDVMKARASLAEAHDAYIPTASIAGGYGTSIGVPLSVPTVFSFSSNSLLFNFSQQDYIRAAAAGLKAAELAAQEMRDKVAEDATLTYLDLDNAEQRAAAMDQEYEDANRLIAIVQQRLDAGQDTQIDLLKARRTAAQIRLSRLHVEDEVATLSDHLDRLLGIAGPLVTVPASIPALPAPSAMAAETGGGDSFGVQSAFAAAQSKLQTAFGEGRYIGRPQFGLGLNYSYINTSHTNYDTYYPAFTGKSRNAASIGIQIQIPLFDRAHQDRAHAAAADANRTRYEAEDQRNQFLDGRYKLRRSLAELDARSDLAGIDHDIAEEQLKIVQLQLSSPSAGGETGPQMTPKDEQSARVQERQLTVNLLAAQQDLHHAQVQLMRQTGTLSEWLRTTVMTPASAPAPATAAH